MNLETQTGLSTLTNPNSDQGISASSPLPKAVMQVTWSLVAGGSEMYAYTVAAGLAPSRYTSSICAVDQGGALEPEVQKSGIPYVIMNRRPGIDLRLMWRLYRHFRRNRVDVINTHHFNQLFYSLFGALLTGARIIHTEHSVEYLKQRRYRLALRVLSRFCYRVIAIGNDGARVMARDVGISRRKLLIIRAGVSVDRFKAPSSSIRPSLGLDKEDPVAVIVARLFPEKNHMLLLAAFQAVTAGLPSAKLLIVGAGIEQENIAAEIERLSLQRSVQMLGVRRDIAQIIAASNAFVLSSDREGLPIAVLEAMAGGLPVVATSVGDIPLVVSDGINGRLVPPQDPAALASALLDLLRDPQTAQQMGSAGRDMVERDFSRESMLRAFELLYSHQPNRDRHL